MAVGPLVLVWLLITFDCALVGYRLAMGRSGLLDKRRYHRRSSYRAAAIGQPAIIVVMATALLLVATGPPDLAAAFDAALVRLLLVAVPYAAAILVATAICVIPSVPTRTAASVVIFGPLSFLRPLAVVVAVAVAVVPDPRWPLVVVGSAVVLPGALGELVLDHRIRRRTLRALADRPVTAGRRSELVDEHGGVRRGWAVELPGAA